LFVFSFIIIIVFFLLLLVLISAVCFTVSAFVVLGNQNKFYSGDVRRGYVVGDEEADAKVGVVKHSRVWSMRGLVETEGGEVFYVYWGRIRFSNTRFLV
jgi:hypothetical protein